jgi:hypothetical protein
VSVHVEKRTGSRPYKIVETITGRVKGSSETRKDAEASARARNAVHRRK